MHTIESVDIPKVYISEENNTILCIVCRKTKQSKYTIKTITSSSNEKMSYEIIHICSHECKAKFDNSVSLYTKTCDYCHKHESFDNRGLYRHSGIKGLFHKIPLANNLLSCWNVHTKNYFCDICEKVKNANKSSCYIWYSDKLDFTSRLQQAYLIDQSDKTKFSEFFEESSIKYFCCDCLYDILNEKDMKVIKTHCYWNDLVKLCKENKNIIDKINNTNKNFRCNKCGTICKISQLKMYEMLNLCTKCSISITGRYY